VVRFIGDNSSLLEKPATIFHGMLRPFNDVAEGAGNHEVRGMVGPAKSEWHYMVHVVILAHPFAAVKAAALLALVLSLYVFGGKGPIGPKLPRSSFLVSRLE
jgi:hypothetical protein